MFHVKLINPYWFESSIKISFIENDFIVISEHGNAVFIENILDKRHYYVHKNSIQDYNILMIN